MPISQVTVGGNCCGACAASYLLEDFLKWVFSNGRIEDMWAQIAFDAGPANANLRSGANHPVLGPYGIHNEDTDPTKLTVLLTAMCPNISAKAYLHPNSPLVPVVPKLFDQSQIVQPHRDGMGLLAGMGNWRGIGIYRNKAGLHYMATRWAGGYYQVMDSNRNVPVYTNALRVMSLNANWNDPTLAETYTYLGAVILVHL